MKKVSELQEWLGQLIAQPLQPNHKLPTQRFSDDFLQETEKHITPSLTLTPLQRIEIYHQQYWWRLLKALQNHFPTVVRLFGYSSFQNELAVPYLSQYPPVHWDLNRLGHTFTHWLDAHYHHIDRYLVTHAASIDWAAQYASWIGPLSSVDFSALNTEERMVYPLTLQPHIHLFNLRGNLFHFRETLLQREVEHYNSSPFPEMSYGNYHFVLYRTAENMVTWREISQAEYELLSYFKQGSTIGEACSKIEEKGGESLAESLIHTPFWFKQWTVLQWFGQLSS